MGVKVHNVTLRGVDFTRIITAKNGHSLIRKYIIEHYQLSQPVK